MQLFYSAFTFYLLQLLFLFSCLVNSSSGRRFSDAYYPGSYYSQEEENKINLALGKLEQGQKWIKDWPDQSIKLGQVSGVALDNSGNLLAFHRGANVWDLNTFTSRDVYANIGEPAIPEPTILVFNESGHLIDSWGQDMFFIPHGITVDHAGNVWLTDVARHQVFKFTPQDRKKPALILGDKFVPGDDDQHFCKPSAVAVLQSGDFFVADGYCNTRIIKYTSSGLKILQFGRSGGNSPFVFNVPHALTLAEDRGLVCVADRERGRVGCFRADNGKYHSGYSSWLIGPRLFSVAYASVHGGRLYVVNGPTQTGLTPVRGYIIDFTTGRLIQTFGTDKGLENPHDIVTSPDGSKVYVAEINPFKVLKFEDDTLGHVLKNVTHVKPTATVEQSSHVEATSSPDITSSEGRWYGAAGWGSAVGGGGLLAVGVLAVVATVALCRARNKGRKSIPRRRWEYGHGEFKLRRLLERRRFTRVHSEDSDEEPAPMLPPQPPANA